MLNSKSLLLIYFIYRSVFRIVLISISYIPDVHPCKQFLAGVSVCYGIVASKNYWFKEYEVFFFFFGGATRLEGILVP